MAPLSSQQDLRVSMLLRPRCDESLPPFLHPRSALHSTSDTGIYDLKLKLKHLPSGKRLHNYGKSQCLMGKSTISTGPFSIANCNKLPEGIAGLKSQAISLINPLVSLWFFCIPVSHDQRLDGVAV